MHPSRDDLIGYLSETPSDPKRRDEIARHLEVCEFCAEFCHNYREIVEMPAATAPDQLPERLELLREALYLFAQRGIIVDLKPLVTERPAVSYLAADGTPDKQPAIRKIATLYSENPEIVVQVMRNTIKGSDYLQVQAEDNLLAAHVMVQLPELGKEYITDSEGRAEIDLGRLENLDKLKWQIKMPEAVFALEPLAYDPDKVQYAKELTLETDRHDRIEIRFEGRTEGKQLSIRVVELEGRTDFDSVKVVVTQKTKSDLVSAFAGVPVEIGPIDPDSTINIRLYQ